MITSTAWWTKKCPHCKKIISIKIERVEGVKNVILNKKIKFKKLNKKEYRIFKKICNKSHFK